MAVLKFVIASLLLLLVEGFDAGVKKLYHTSDQVDSELRSLSKTCPGMQVNYHKGKTGKATLTSVSLKQDGGAAKKLKVLLFFGEHSRELVSVESGLSLIQHLCGKASNVPANLVDYSLKNAEFLIFTNIGVNSRRNVEKGKYCLRVNENGVDLNRNWNDHWTNIHQHAETSPGAGPFTEDETIILRDASSVFKPDMFLTVHSGALGMYIPYAYSDNEVVGASTPAMLEILNKMNPKYCNCDVGAAGKQVGYLCPGTCLDYIYDLGTKYSFAFEIYEEGRYKREVGMTGIEEGPGSCMLLKSKADHSHGQDHNHDAFADDNDDSFLELSGKVLSVRRLQGKFQSKVGTNFPRAATPSREQCQKYFNPVTVPQYKGAMKNWISAYLELVQEVNEHHKTIF